MNNKFKELALKRLEQMTADDFIRVFEKIGSQKIDKSKTYRNVKRSSE